MPARITRNGRTVEPSELPAIMETHRALKRVAGRKLQRGESPYGGAGSRVLATRTDIGTKNARLGATGAERARRGGAVNPRSSAEFVAADRVVDGNAWTFNRSDSDRMTHPNKDGS